MGKTSHRVRYTYKHAPLHAYYVHQYMYIMYTLHVYYMYRDLAKATKGGGAPSYFRDPPPYIVAPPLFIIPLPPFLLLALGLKCFRIVAKGHGLLKKPRNHH